ncbi:hypothetical protein [uncultured Chitinophaga sp.]|uniref:hypothetical protein n=1 Tax=uncultured Chitinophaga sp. TaxID=339340 RepID=UPI0025F8847F|nr:hypothetical protein [uncultured Chitinophaga sp.]
MKRKLYCALAAIVLAFVVVVSSHYPAAKAATTKAAVLEKQYCAWMMIPGNLTVKVKFINIGTQNYLVGVYDLNDQSLAPAGGTLASVNPAVQSVFTGTIWYVQNGVSKSGTGTLYSFSCVH